METRQLLALGLMCLGGVAQGQTLVEESFDDYRLADRGWYDLKGVGDSRRMRGVSTAASSALEFRFRRGATTPEAKLLRRKFAETNRVYLRYRVKYSDNWQGSNKSYQPHQFYFLTNKDGAYAGPASSHLTMYVEDNGGRPHWAAQDALNIDTSRVGQDLVDTTERRAIAGCNGSTDGYKDSCYAWNGGHRNWKQWSSPEVVFVDRRGPNYKGDWHLVEAYVQLNSVKNGRASRDGVLRMWVDGRQVIEHTDVVLRTGAHADMKFNQLIIGPYIGDPGSPIDQSFWIDDLMLATRRPPAALASVPSSPPDVRPLD